MALKCFDARKFFQDEHGTWWYRAGKKQQRLKAYVKTCPRCHADFLTAGAKAIHCSHACAMQASWKTRKPPVVVTTVVPPQIKARSPERFQQDSSGQWWWVSGTYRLRTEVKKCAHCGSDFLAPHNRTSRQTPYCSRKCGITATYAVMPKENRSYEHARAWRGGRRMVNGYVHVYDPVAARAHGRTRPYIPEHRLVMEQVLGRQLKSYETVHHKNGIRDDNRPENLELWKQQQPYGQRADEQQIKHCPTCTCGSH